jgi:hypothetical protein
MNLGQVLTEISDGNWVSKDLLVVPTEVRQALQGTNSWLNSSVNSTPDIKTILDFFTGSELSDETKFAGIETLQSIYGANKASNSKLSPGSTGDELLNRLANDKANKETYVAATEVNNLLINWQNVIESNYSNNDDLYLRIKDAEDDNKSFFTEKILEIKEAIVDIHNELIAILSNSPQPIGQIIAHFVASKLNFQTDFEDAKDNFKLYTRKLVLLWKNVFTGFRLSLLDKLAAIKQQFFGTPNYKPRVAAARAERWQKVDAMKAFRTQFVIASNRKIAKILAETRQLFEVEEARYDDDTLRSQFQAIPANFSPTGIVEVPTNLDAYNVLSTIAGSMLSTFVLRGASLPPAFFAAIKNTVTSIVTKRFDIPASEALRNISGSVLKSVGDILPAIFSESGMFAGAWGMLTACAPYILAGAILVIIAIKMAKENQLGSFICLLGRIAGRPEPDVCFARIIGNSFEMMNDIRDVRNTFLEETRKRYISLTVLTFKGDELGRSFDFISEVPIILTPNIAIAIKTSYANIEYLDF